MGISRRGSCSVAGRFRRALLGSETYPDDVSQGVGNPQMGAAVVSVFRFGAFNAVSDSLSWTEEDSEQLAFSCRPRITRPRSVGSLLRLWLLVYVAANSFALLSQSSTTFRKWCVILSAPSSPCGRVCINEGSELRYMSRSSKYSVTTW